MKRNYLFVLLFAFIAQASAKDLCEKVFNAAASALEEKASGATQGSLRKSLPLLNLAKAEPTSDNSVLLAAMHEIVEEIYSVKKLDKFLYSVFKSEQCHRKSKGQSYVAFSSASKALSHCAQSKQVDPAECAMIAAGSSPDEG